MNKKTAMIASGVSGLVLSLGACGNGGTYQYDVSGTVEAQQVDYDCPGEDLALDAVAFVAGSDKGSGSGGSGSGKKATKSDSGSDSDSGSGDNKSEVKKDDKAPAKKTEQKAPAAQAPAAKPLAAASGPAPQKSRKASSKPVKNKGVSLNKKPEKAEKLKGKKVPKVKYLVKPKGCEIEYEIFVLDGDDLYEQDVRRADYDKCLTAKVQKGQTKKLFPLCTKG